MPLATSRRAVLILTAALPFFGASAASQVEEGKVALVDVRRSAPRTAKCDSSSSATPATERAFRSGARTARKRSPRDSPTCACLPTSFSSWGTTSTGAAAPRSTRRASTTSTIPSSASARPTWPSGTTTSRAAGRWRSTSAGRAAFRTSGPRWSRTARRATCAREWRSPRQRRRQRRTPRRRRRESWRWKRWPRARPTACRGTPPLTRTRSPAARPATRRRPWPTLSSASERSRRATRRLGSGSGTTAFSGPCPRWRRAARSPLRGT